MAPGWFEMRACAAVLAMLASMTAVHARGDLMRPTQTPGSAGPSAVPNSSNNIHPMTSPGPYVPPQTQSMPEGISTPSNLLGPEDLTSPELLKNPTRPGPDPNQTVTDPTKQLPVSGTVQYNAGGPPVDYKETNIIQALNEALMNSPRAAAIRSQLQIAKAGIAGATVAPNPIFFYDRGILAEGVRRIGPSLSIEPPWKLAFRMMASVKFYDQTKLDLLNNLWSLRADVRRAYTEVVIAVESQHTLNELYELTERLLEVSKKRFQAGDVPELDVLRAQLATSQVDVDRNVGRQRIIRARQQLNIIMGRKVEQRLEVPRMPEYIGKEPTQLLNAKATRHGLLPDFAASVQPLQYYVDVAQENRYELKSLVAQQSVNKWNMRNAVGNVVPNPIVSFGSSENANFPSGPNLTAQFITLNLEMPISNVNQGEIAKFGAQKRQLNYQVNSQKNVVVAEVSSAYNNLLAARERIRVYQEHVLRDSAEVARLSRRSYEVGQSDINSTLLAQQANVAIRQAYLDAVTQYQAAFTDLEQACGRPLD